MRPLSKDALSARLQEAGYVATAPIVVAVASILRPAWPGGARAILLEGPPGCGKSSLAGALASALDAPLVVYQCHEWSDADEMFVGVDVTAAVAGDAAAVRQPGVLARAAELSHEGAVVLLIDELDKAQERTEALLLDYLASGRVPLAPGRHIVADLNRLVVIATSNGSRPLMDATYRRFRRLRLSQPPADVVDSIVESMTRCPRHICAMARKVAYSIAEREGFVPSAIEIAQAVSEAWAVASSAADVAEAFRGWICRDPAAHVTAADVSALWAEIKRSRRE